MPVVVKFSLSKEIVPDESVIEPSARVSVPTVDPVAVDIVLLVETAPFTNSVPETFTPSLICMAVESVDEISLTSMVLFSEAVTPLPDTVSVMPSPERNSKSSPDPLATDPEFEAESPMVNTPPVLASTYALIDC